MVLPAPVTVTTSLKRPFVHSDGLERLTSKLCARAATRAAIVAATTMTKADPVGWAKARNAPCPRGFMQVICCPPRRQDDECRRWRSDLGALPLPARTQACPSSALKVAEVG